MKLTKTILICVAISLAAAPLFAQFGPPPPPKATEKAQPSPGVDLSGYWTPPLHEDALERGGGSEIGDYAGFALNEAGRLWALSYDPSRVTLKHHQCDAYVAPYQMRAIGNFRIWEERDPHYQTLVRDSYLGADHRRPSRHLDGWPSASSRLGAAHLPRILHRQVGRECARTRNHAHEAGLAAPQRDAGKRPGHGDRIHRAARRPSEDTTVITDPVFLTEPEVRSNDYFRHPVDHHAWLYACDDGEQITGRAPDKVPNYLFGQQPFANEFAKLYKLPLDRRDLGRANRFIPNSKPS